MPIVKFKRGTKSNLPASFSLGEPRFTTDTNELYIGTGTNYTKIEPIGENLLINSNFQVPVEATDNTDLGNNTISNGSGRYIFGHFYLSNAATTTSTITYYRPNDSNDLLQLTCSGGIPSLSYYTKLPTMNFYPLESKTVTLSFDTVSTSVISYQSGPPNTTLVSGQIPIGTARNSISFTYTSTTLSGRSNISMNIVLFKCSSSFSGTLSIGNFKLEQGTKATYYSPNPIEEDIMMLKEGYDVINDRKRICLTTDTKQIYFDSRVYIYNMPPTLRVTRNIVYDMTGTVAPGYSAGVYFNVNSLNADLRESGSGVTDGSVDVQIVIDNRP